MAGQDLSARGGRFRSLNPLLHLTRRSPPSPLGEVGPLLTDITVKIVCSWRVDAIFTRDGLRGDMLTARLEVPLLQSRLLLARHGRSWAAVPMTNLELMVLAQEAPVTDVVELRAVPESRKVIVTFGQWEAVLAETVKIAGGRFGLRYFITFRAEVHGRHVILSADRKYPATLEMSGPYELLPKEPQVELFY